MCVLIGPSKVNIAYYIPLMKALLDLAPSSRFTDDVLVFALVFTNHKRYLRLVNLDESDQFHDIAKSVLGMNTILRNRIRESTSHLLRGVNSDNQLNGVTVTRTPPLFTIGR